MNYGVMKLEMRNNSCLDRLRKFIWLVTESESKLFLIQMVAVFLLQALPLLLSISDPEIAKIFEVGSSELELPFIVVYQSEYAIESKWPFDN